MALKDMDGTKVTFDRPWVPKSLITIEGYKDLPMTPEEKSNKFIRETAWIPFAMLILGVVIFIVSCII